MKTKIKLVILLLAAAFYLSSCMVIVDLIEESKQGRSSDIQDSNPQQGAPIPENKAYLDFPIDLIDGGTTTLRDQQGKTVLMVFFSVGCGHCHNEASHLEAIYQDLKGEGFIIIASEVSGADLPAIAEFSAEYGITFPIGKEADYLFAQEMQVTGVPHNVLFDTQGNIATVIRGFSDAASLQNSIELQLGK